MSEIVWERLPLPPAVRVTRYEGVYIPVDDDGIAQPITTKVTYSTPPPPYVAVRHTANKRGEVTERRYTAQMLANRAVLAAYNPADFDMPGWWRDMI